MNRFKFPLFITVIFSVIALLFSACASTNGSEPEETGHSKASYEAPAVSEKSEESSTTQSAEAIKLPSSSKSKSYFSKINDDIVKNVEKGSPESISTAMSSIKKSETSLSQNEKVLIYVASEIMRILWPSQKITWTTYDVTDETPNPYTFVYSADMKALAESQNAMCIAGWGLNINKITYK